MEEESRGSEEEMYRSEVGWYWSEREREEEERLDVAADGVAP